MIGDVEGVWLWWEACSILPFFRFSSFCFYFFDSSFSSPFFLFFFSELVKVLMRWLAVF